MAKAKRVEPEWMAPVLKFQRRYERELTAVKRQAEARRVRAKKAYDVIVVSYLKVSKLCDKVLSEMQVSLQGIERQLTQPPTLPPAKKAPPTRKGKV